MLNYTSNGKTMHVLAQGDQPDTAPPKQVAFQIDYTGGYQKYFRENPAAKAALGGTRAASKP